MFSLDSYIVVINRAIILVQEKWEKEGLTKSSSKENLEEGGVEEEDVVEELDPKALKKRVDDLVESTT